MGNKCCLIQFLALRGTHYNGKMAWNRGSHLPAVHFTWLRWALHAPRSRADNIVN